MPQTFHTPSRWIDQRVNIVLLGAGGTGGEVLYALARTHKTLLALGHPGGLHVTLLDGDHVSIANIGRQRFAECDIGHSKAHVLIQRLNLFFGFDWDAIHAYWSPDEWRAPHWNSADLIISCVDRAKVRVALARAGRHFPTLLWMDFGNGAHLGQCVLGHFGHPAEPSQLHLPNVFDLNPELATLDDTDTPSCSAVEALHQQDLFVNPLLAEAGVAILWKLLRHGGTDSHGVLIDARVPSVDPLLIGADHWASFGYQPRIARAA
jgi:PRTRC genetic system ThiF family protein